MSDEPSVALVVRSFNEERHIGRLLAGAMRQTHPAREIVLVDSGSTDATVSIARQFSGVRVVSIAPDEFSFGRALNRGIAACTSDVAAFASAHVYPLRTSWLAALVAPFRDDDVVITYGRQVGDENSRFSEHQLFNRWFPPTSEVTNTNPFCNNANAAIRVSWWAENPYDEELTGLEDVGAGHVAIAKHKKIAYVADAPVAHVHEEDFRRVLNRYRREAIALKRVYPTSHMSVLEALAMFASNAGSDSYAALRQRQLKALPDIVTFRSAQFIGGFLGHRQPTEVPLRLKRRLYYPRRFWRERAEEPDGQHPGEAIEYGVLGEERGPVA